MQSIPGQIKQALSSGLMRQKAGDVCSRLKRYRRRTGICPDAVTSEHFGLGIMRERAAAIGAKLNIRSRAGEGTTIELEWVGGKRTQWNIEMRDKSE